MVDEETLISQEELQSSFVTPRQKALHTHSKSFNTSSN
jgi:hypothetical protein